MKQLTILSGRCLVVELPEGAKHKRIEVRHLGCFLVTTNTRGELMTKLPPGNWRIIGMLSEATEGQAMLVVPIHRQSIIGDVYKDFKTGKWDAFDALESLESAILADGYTFSPELSEIYDSESECMRVIESRVLDRSRCLLLGRVDG